MSAPRVSMHLVKEVLRLTAAGLSQRQIGRSLHLSHGVVGKYQAAAQRAGLSWPLPEELDDAALAARLCARTDDSGGASGRWLRLHPVLLSLPGVAVTPQTGDAPDASGR